jgi:hypothetical protein
MHVVRCFFGLSSYSQRTPSVSCICRQMFFRPQLVPHREDGLSQLCMSSDVSSASARTHREHRLSHASVVRCFFGLSSNRTENTICPSYVSAVSSFFGRSSYHTENTACLSCVSVVRCYMGLSSYVTGTESVPTMKSGHKVGLRVKRLTLSDLTKIGQRYGDNCTTNNQRTTPWRSVQWEQSCSMRTDGRTHIHNEGNSHFSQLTTASNNELKGCGASRSAATSAERLWCKPQCPEIFWGQPRNPWGWRVSEPTVKHDFEEQVF